MDLVLLDGFEKTFVPYSSRQTGDIMDMYTHEVAALIFAHNVEKGAEWAFEKAEQFMEESDRRVLENEMTYWDNYDSYDWDSDDEYDSQNAPNYPDKKRQSP